MVLAAIATQPAEATVVDLRLLPASASVQVGNAIDVELWATARDNESQSVSAMAVLLQWDAQDLGLLGLTNNGPYGWLSSCFPDDSGLDGLNNTWTDGDARYEALALLGSPAIATGSGLLVTTLRFEALRPAAVSTIDIPAALGQSSFSKVLGADFPNQDVTGSLGIATIAITPEPAGAVLLLLAACAFRHPHRRRHRH